MKTLRWVDMLVIGLYFLVVAGIGWHFSRQQTTTEAYYVARRRVPFWAMGLSVFATIISSITFIAYPGAAFNGDWNLLVPGFMAVGVLCLLGRTLVEFFRKAARMSAYEYFERRFGYSARAYGALAFCAGHFSKMGFVLFTITTAICAMTGWGASMVIIVAGSVTVLYTLFGGLEAVIWTEVLQGFVKLAGVVVALGVLIHLMPGGLPAAWNLASAEHKLSLGDFHFNLAEKGNFWVMILYGGFWYLQKYAADQTLVQRYLVARSDREALRGVTLGALLCLPAWMAFMLTGTLLWAFFQLSGHVLPPQMMDGHGGIIADRVFPYFLTVWIPPGLAGLFIAALLSAAMSTMSSDLNCLSAVGVTDFYMRLNPGAGDRKKLWVGKIIVGVCGLVAVGVGEFIAREGDHALALYYATTAIASAGLAGMFLLAFFTERANRQGLWVGLGCALVFTAWAVLTTGPGRLLDLGWNYSGPEVMIGVLAHLIVLVVGYAASWFFPKEASGPGAWTFWQWRERSSPMGDENMAALGTQVNL